MTTAEDVFYLYERNSRYYNNNLENETSTQNVLPLTIGDQETPCDFKVKCYIRPGEECPICFDNINNKSSAFITYCGHNYHKKCMFNYLKSKWLSSKYTSVARCPLCRCSVGHPEFLQRYKSSYFSYNYYDNNELDKLEDFWLSCEYKLPNFCSNGYDHYLGMCKNCFNCENYRENGTELC
jgi:hypothetical protein